MEPNEAASPERTENPARRVGTFTMGAVLILSGSLMLASMFFPDLDFTLVFKLSPLILVSLGIETLLAGRKGSRVRYDWVGMVLTALIVCTALTLFVIAWCLVHKPGYINL